MNIIKPALLKTGDTIGILASSGCIDEDTKLKRAISFFENKGFKIKLSKNVCSKNRYLAGSDEDRINAIHDMFSDENVNAIIALRGGYGALRIINKINYDIIKNNPKIFCGYSDITILNAMFLKHANLMTYSGPMIVSDFGAENLCDYTVDRFFKVLQSDLFDYSGNFWGGNLSSLVSLCGVDFVPDYKFDLFLEDLNEPVYKIDRMLRQLFNIQKLKDNVKSLYIGDFLYVDEPEYLKQLFNEISSELNIPVIEGFPASHSERKATIPYGKLYNL